MNRRQVLTAAGGGALATAAGGMAYIEFVIDPEPVTGFYYTEPRDVEGQCVIPYTVERTSEDDTVVVEVDGETVHSWGPRSPLRRLLLPVETARLTVDGGSSITVTVESDGETRELTSLDVTDDCEVVEQEVDR